MPNILTTLAGGQNSGPATDGGLPGIGPTNMPAQPVGMGAVAQTGVTPQNALTNSLLSRGAGADRFKIAQDQWDAFTKASAPQYEADQRSAMRRAAAGGALGSGMLQTSLGDLASNRALAMDTQKQNLLSEALKGTIGDQFQDVGIAQQQQGFQQGQQGQAFDQNLRQALTEDTLTGSKFQRALQSLGAGGQGNPADMAMVLSQMFGGQSSAAGSSLAQFLSGMGQKSAGTAAPAQAPASSGMPAGMADFIKQYFGGGVGVPTSSGKPTSVAPIDFGGGNY
jgi:hypothetical protein